MKLIVFAAGIAAMVFCMRECVKIYRAFCFDPEMTYGALALIAGVFYLALSVVARSDELGCLGRPGIYLCIGDGALTGDPGRDRRTIARLRVAKAEVDVERLGAPIEIAQPSPEPRQVVVDRLNDARVRMIKDCAPDTADAVK